MRVLRWQLIRGVQVVVERGWGGSKYGGLRWWLKKGKSW